jgi:hypothetical protein
MMSKSTKKLSTPSKAPSQRINNKVKTGRRASIEERSLAAELLKHFATEKDVTVLVKALERFSQNGSFVVDEKQEQDLMLALQHRANRSSGLTVEKSTDKLAAVHHISEVTVKRRISNAIKNPIASNNPLINFLQTQLLSPIKQGKGKGKN